MQILTTKVFFNILHDRYEHELRHHRVKKIASLADKMTMWISLGIWALFLSLGVINLTNVS